MDNVVKKVALVTGASSGIGEATAERLVKAGYKVYGTSRRGGKAGERSFEMLSLDVTSDASADAAVREIIRANGRIDLLVNNAGEVGLIGLSCRERGRPARWRARGPRSQETATNQINPPPSKAILIL